MNEMISMVKQWGLSVSLSRDGERLQIHPWSRANQEQRKWFRENKSKLIDVLKSEGFQNFVGSVEDGSFPEFLKKKTLFGDAVAEAINENFVSAFVAKGSTEKGCGCKDYAKTLNSRGVEQCIATRGEIENKLVDQSDVLLSGSKLIPKSLKRWQAKRIVDAAIEKTTPDRPKLPDDVAVVTAADAGFTLGLYGLAWTTIYQNDVRFVCYDVGLSSKQSVSEMSRWGVEFTPWESVLRSSVDGWQTYNKPFIIRDAMKRFGRVIWIDSDVLIGGDISPVVDMLSNGLVVADHGLHEPPENENASCLNNVLGIPKRDWGNPANAYPCCGFMAFNSARDATFVDAWCDAVERVETGNAWNCVSYYDQGVFQHVYDGGLVDGSIWNNVRVPRRGSAAEILRHVFDHRAVVHHSGGKMKYWQPWKRVRWNNPNFVGSL